VRLVLYTGKGGVGKTTTAAATAACAAARGRRTLVASADAAHSLGDVLGCRLGPRPQPLAENLDAIEIDARVEMLRHWGSVREFLVATFEHQGIDAVVAEELALLPGAEELTTLLAVEDTVRAERYDFIVVDCAPTDSTLRLLTLPEVARGFVRVVLPILSALAGLAAPIARRIVAAPLPGRAVFRDIDDFVYHQLSALQSRLSDPSTSVRLVVTPERMVIDEARRAHTDLALFEIPCDAVIMNRVLPAAAADEEFFRDWSRLQVERRREVEELFAPLPVLAAPLEEDEVIGLERLAAHGERIFADVEPDATLSRAPQVRFTRKGDDYLAIIPLPGAVPDQLDVARLDDELVITTGSRRRALKLPRRFASLDLASARLADGAMTVAFKRRPAPGAGA
jgi:arsenite-transporting ATPase